MISVYLLLDSNMGRMPLIHTCINIDDRLAAFQHLVSIFNKTLFERLKNPFPV